MDLLRGFLFSDGGYSPHGFCIAWNPAVLYTHVGADLLIALSYFAIPAIMLVFLRRRRDPALHAPALLFVVFITLCGISHLMSILTMYLPWYGLQGMIKLVTGAVSFLTAIALWKMMPGALRIPTPASLIGALKEKEREIVERNAAEAQLKHQNVRLDRTHCELRAANAELREFADAASRDLRAPVNAMMLWLQHFDDSYGARLDDEAHDLMVEARRTLLQMRTLVDDVNSYSRVVNSEDGAVSEVDMDCVTSDVMKDLADEIAAARPEFDLPPLPPIRARAPLMQLLVRNLLSNALKFRARDRLLRIAIRAEILDGETPRYVLRIRDNGIGLPRGTGDRIFSMFERAHSPELYPGSGLGLALCRRIAVTHGGRIEVESREGEGSEFIVTLPQDLAPQAAAA